VLISIILFQAKAVTITTKGEWFKCSVVVFKVNVKVPAPVVVAATAVLLKPKMSVVPVGYQDVLQYCGVLPTDSFNSTSLLQCL